MNQTLVHRGPDSEGYYFGKRCGIGMRRLKIIDIHGSEQPIYNEDKSLVLVCNGEIYNFRTLRKRLEDRGHHFSTNGDVETIVHLYEEYEDNCVLHLEGMFAFALYDIKHRRLLLARDRLGIKPLYWAKFPNRFLFSSEIRAMAASGEISMELDEVSIIRYLTYPAVPAPLTIYKQIKAMLPGHTLRVESAGIVLREYWDVDFMKASSVQLSEEESSEAVLETLKESVKMRMVSDVPIGAFLSGGIDSSTVVALMRSYLDKPVRTFNIHFSGKGKDFQWYDDAKYATQLANKLGTDHTEEVVSGKDVLDNLADAVWAMDQPSGDALQYYLVSKSARKQVTVAMSGTGGDEVFAGYEWFKDIQKIEYFHNSLGWLNPQMAEQLLELLRIFPRRYELPSFLHKIETVLMGRRGFSERYRLNRRLYRRDDFFYLFSPEFISLIADYPLDYEEQIEKYSLRCEGLDPVAQTSYLQLKTDMPNLLLRDHDAMSMAVSLEVRLPLIDRKVIELVAHIPSELKLKGKQEKYILRRAMSNILPEEIVNRGKKGFIFPMGYWMQNELKPVVLSCLSKEATRRRGIFNPYTIESLKDDFYKGKQPFFKIWNQVVFELWCRIMLDREKGWEKPSGDIRDFI